MLLITANAGNWDMNPAVGIMRFAFQRYEGSGLRWRLPSSESDIAENRFNSWPAASIGQKGLDELSGRNRPFTPPGAPCRGLLHTEFSEANDVMPHHGVGKTPARGTSSGFGNCR
jgi:hypothetical protein